LLRGKFKTPNTQSYGRRVRQVFFAPFAVKSFWQQASNGKERKDRKDRKEKIANSKTQILPASRSSIISH